MAGSRFYRGAGRLWGLNRQPSSGGGGPVVGAGLIADPHFASSGAWTSNGPTIANGLASWVSSTNGRSVQPNPSIAASIIPGVTYRVSLTIANFTSGIIGASVGGASIAGQNSAGAVVQDVLAVSATNPLVRNLSPNTTADVSFFQVQPLS